MAEVPIIPCLIFGSDRLYAARSWWPGGPPRVPIWMTMGAPIRVSELEGKQADERVANGIRELGTATIAHFGLKPDDLPATPQQRMGRSPA